MGANDLPSTKSVVAALTKLASDPRARVPNDQRSDFCKRLGETIWRAWRASDKKVSGTELKAVILRLQRAEAFATDLLRALSNTRLEKWSLEWLDEGLDAHKASVTSALATIQHLEDVAKSQKRRPGGQPARAGVYRAFERFAEDVCRASLAAGVKLTADRNNPEAGSLVFVLDALRPYLPDGFVPQALSARTLDRIANGLDANSSASA